MELLRYAKVLPEGYSLEQAEEMTTKWTEDQFNFFSDQVNEFVGCGFSTDNFDPLKLTTMERMVLYCIKEKRRIQDHVDQAKGFFEAFILKTPTPSVDVQKDEAQFEVLEEISSNYIAGLN